MYGKCKVFQLNVTTTTHFQRTITLTKRTASDLLVATTSICLVFSRHGTGGFL